LDYHICKSNLRSTEEILKTLKREKVSQHI
jgi:hypothetical protein